MDDSRYTDCVPPAFQATERWMLHVMLGWVTSAWHVTSTFLLPGMQVEHNGMLEESHYCTHLLRSTFLYVEKTVETLEMQYGTNLTVQLWNHYKVRAELQIPSSSITGTITSWKIQGDREPATACSRWWRKKEWLRTLWWNFQKCRPRKWQLQISANEFEQWIQ